METKERAILVLGTAEPAEALLVQAGGYAEVFVLARAVDQAQSRYVIDEGRARADARRRLDTVLARLGARGARGSGRVGDPDPRAARRDALALFPGAQVLLEAA